MLPKLLLQLSLFLKNIGGGFYVVAEKNPQVVSQYSYSPLKETMAEYTNVSAGFVLLQMLKWPLLVMEDSKFFGQPHSPKGMDF